MFDPFWSSLPESRRSEWLEDKIARGLTHLVLSRAYRYPRYEARTGFAGSDGLDGATLAARVHEAYQGGLWSIVWLYDDDADGQAAVYDGRMRAMAEALVSVADELGGVVPAWETAGAWSARAQADAGQLLHDMLGVRGVPIILHGRDNERCTGASFRGYGTQAQIPAGMIWIPDPKKPGYGSFVESDDPSRGDEAGWWYVPGADKYTDFFWESRHGSDGPSYSDGNADPDGGTWLGRCVECWERFAPPGTHMPALGRDVRTPDMHGRTAPDWFAAPRAGGRVRFTPFELEEYEDVTDEIPDARITHVADRLLSFGFTRFGSGIPSSY